MKSCDRKEMAKTLCQLWPISTEKITEEIMKIVSNMGCSHEELSKIVNENDENIRPHVAYIVANIIDDMIVA